MDIFPITNRMKKMGKDNHSIFLNHVKCVMISRVDFKFRIRGMSMPLQGIERQTLFILTSNVITASNRNEVYYGFI